MIGYFEITEFLDGTDAAGAAFRARAKGVPDSGKVADLYLPPYLRKTQCDIDNGSRVFAVVDDVTGLGAALFGENGADFGYFVNADLRIDGGLSVTGDTGIGGNASITGDATAGGNVTATDCRITIASIPNPEWIDDGQGTDPDAYGHPKMLPAAVSSLAQHTHTCAAPGSPTTPPIPTPIPG